MAAKNRSRVEKHKKKGCVGCSENLHNFLLHQSPFQGKSY